MSAITSNFRPLEDSATGWLYEKVKDDLAIHRDEYRIKIIGKIACSAIVYPLFALSAIVESVARSALFLIAKIPHLILFSDWKITKSMNKNFMWPLKTSINSNMYLAYTCMSVFTDTLSRAHLNGYAFPGVPFRP